MRLTLPLVIAAATVLDGSIPQAGGRPPAEPRVVDSVDLQRYVGTWYEVARFPNRFQDHCASDVVAEYSLRPDGRIDVVNRCRRADGSMDEARGVARRAGGGGQSDAKLEVRFAPAFLSFLPMVWGDYWILGLGPDYNWSVVGDPGRKYLWILSRTPALSAPSCQQALEVARANGFTETLRIAALDEARILALQDEWSAWLDGFPPADLGDDLVAFVGGTLFPAPDAEPIPDGVLLVSNGKIWAAGARAEVAIPEQAERVDCAGGSVVAGFWNSHVHFTEPKWAGAAELPAEELALSERVKADDAHPPGQRVGQGRHQQHVGRAREQEPAGLPVPVDRGLERSEDARRPLHFVENHALGEIAHEANRVRRRGGEGHLVIEREVGVLPGLADRLGQRRLSALPRPVQENYGRVGQRLRKARRNESRIEAVAGHAGQS